MSSLTLIQQVSEWLNAAYEGTYQVFTFLYRFVRVFTNCFLFFFVAYLMELNLEWTKYLMICAFFGGLVIALEEQGIFQFFIKKWRAKK